MRGILNTRAVRWAAITAAGAAMAVVAAFVAAGRPATAADREFPVASDATVNFRRDFLGAKHGEPLPSGWERVENFGKSLRGRIKSANNDWLIMVQTEQGGEVWVPRDAVLFIRVHSY